MPVSMTFIRWFGLSGSVMLAVAGWLGGAHPDADLRSTPVSIAQGPYGPAILGLWLLGTAIQAYAWWSGRDRVPSVRWGLVTALLWSLPFLLTPPVGSRDFYSYWCQGEMFLHDIDPYRFGVDALPCTYLETVSPIWRESVTPYGPMFILVAAFAVWLGSNLTTALVLFRLVTLAGMAAIAAGLPALARRCGVDPQRAVWVALAGPLIGAHLLGAPHNDAVMLGFAVLGFFVIVRASSHPVALVAGGALLGLAFSVKATTVVLIPFAVLIAARSFLAATALVGGGALASFGVVTVTSGLGFGWVPAMQGSVSLIQFSSPPTAVGMTITYLGRPFSADFNAVPFVRNVALALLAVTLVWLWVRALRTPAQYRTRAALRGAALALTAFVVLSPVFHPWYALWPLTFLAATTVRNKAMMVITIISAFIVLPDGSGLTRFVKFPGAPIVTIVLIVLAVRYFRQRQAAARTPHPVTTA
ncbi:hypothetical protein MB27_27535 [Actinoplanes utahensis]|uniref:DUF2029 domain-containing protein n=2 Tax=Actinoplanes utahensis TaxID=1869 RepID=A0A0A6UF35_ACTUT|nr:hypothetical protein MB27_27535 [Actinoplanes utahensis]